MYIYMSSIIYIYIFGLNVENNVIVFPPNLSFINPITFLFCHQGNILSDL